MAESIKRKFGVEAKLIEGNRGEFTVWAGNKLVCEKTGDEFPEEQDVLEALRPEIVA